MAEAHLYAWWHALCLPGKGYVYRGSSCSHDELNYEAAARWQTNTCAGTGKRHRRSSWLLRCLAPNSHSGLSSIFYLPMCPFFFGPVCASAAHLSSAAYAPRGDFDAADEDGSELQYYSRRSRHAFLLSSYFAPLSPTPRSSPPTSLPPQAFPSLSHQAKHALPDDWPLQINHLTPFVPDILRSIHTFSSRPLPLRTLAPTKFQLIGMACSLLASRPSFQRMQIPSDIDLSLQYILHRKPEPEPSALAEEGEHARGARAGEVHTYLSGRCSGEG
ncbi:hypothetical protein B0H14DRAFT_3782919 [Mycena olivaceomarginata]|nr:hypothetical protein B0H14DRAFT_3782919 [Mycena olivaceomarginata]